MTNFHYPLPEQEPQSPWGGLSDEARTALTSAAIGPSVANQLLRPDGQATAELNPDSQAVVVEAHQKTVDLFAASNGSLIVPELGSAWFADINWGHVQGGFDVYNELNMQPELVISPEGMSLDFWQNVYSQLRLWQDNTQPQASHRLQNLSDGDGLYVNAEVAANWDKLVKVSSGDIPNWKVSVVPSTPKAPALNISHEDLTNRYSNIQDDVLINILRSLPGSTAQPHMSIDSYLTLQAARLQSGDEPIDTKIGDTYFWSWLNGTFTNSENNLVAPYGGWGPDGGRVRLGWCGVGYRFGNLGVRPEVRGDVS